MLFAIGMWFSFKWGNTQYFPLYYQLFLTNNILNKIPFTSHFLANVSEHVSKWWHNAKIFVIKTACCLFEHSGTDMVCSISQIICKKWCHNYLLITNRMNVTITGTPYGAHTTGTPCGAHITGSNVEQIHNANKC